MHSPSLTSCFSTLILLIIKDIRYERGIHQGALAQSTGKTPNAWTKIENGQSALTMDMLFGACAALMVPPPLIMAYANQLTPIFNSAGWFFQTVSLEKEEDKLLPLMLSFYTSKGYERLSSNSFALSSKVSIVDFCSSLRNTYQFPSIVRYCCEPDYREWIDSGEEFPSDRSLDISRYAWSHKKESSTSPSE